MKECNKCGYNAATNSKIFFKECYIAGECPNFKYIPGYRSINDTSKETQQKKQATLRKKQIEDE